MSDELNREDIDRLAAYADRRAAEWSRGMDSEQALYEPSDKCEVTIWELQQLIVEARRTVPGLVQYNSAVADRDRLASAYREQAGERERLRALLRRCEEAITELHDGSPERCACPMCVNANTVLDDVRAALKEDDHG